MASPTASGADGLPSLSEVAAWQERAAANVAAFFEQVVRAMDRRWTHWDDAWAADLQGLSPFFNSATLVRPLDPAQATDLIDRLSHFYAAQPGAPWILWSAWSAPDLQRWGFELLTRLPLMVRPAGGALPAPPPLLRIVEATDAATLADGERVTIEGYPLPELQPVRTGSLFDARGVGARLRMWVGYLDDRAVATATALIDEAVNGIYAVATLPDVRGHGYGTALTAQALAAAPALPAVLEATDAGYSIYARLGFTEVARYDLWMKAR